MLRALLRPAILTPFLAFLYFFLRYHSHAYLLGGALVLAGFLVAYSLWNQVERGPYGIVVLILVGLGLPALGIWQFLQLQDLGDMDQAMYSCAFWNIRHGWIHYSIRGTNMFGVHSQYTAMFWIPWHWLTGELGLKIGKCLFLLAAALLVLRRHGGNLKVLSWAAVAILLSPPIASQFFFGFHPEFIAAPILVLLLEAYRDGKLGRFLAYVAFLAYSKEVFTLVVGGVLLLALVEKRPWKWIVLPGLLCCLQMAIYWFVIMPRFAPAGNFLSSYMPTSIQEAMAMWRRPEVLRYALHIALPFLPLLLAFPKRYLLLPLPLMAFYAAFPDSLFMVMWPNYAFPLAILCAAGLILQPEVRWSDIGSVEACNPPGSVSLDGRILLACVATSLLSYPLWREAFSIPHGNLGRNLEIKKIHDRIPENASVLVNGPFVTRFAARREIGIWGYRIKPVEAYDYIVLDAKLPYWLNRNNEAILSKGIVTLANSPEWTMEYGRDSLYLFHHAPKHVPTPL